MANQRKGSYGQTIRVNAGVDLTQFTGQAGRDITLIVSASSNGGFSLNYSASTLFIGHSTVHSSIEGITFQSAQWVYGQPATADAWGTADDYNGYLRASATGVYFISPLFTITIDE